MANHILPQLGSNYTDVLTQFHDKINDVAKGLDPATTSVSNLVTGAISWQMGSNSWQKWTGTGWENLSTLYAINVSGNAATATKLTTARTIGGVSFDGTANINLPGVNSAGSQSTTGNAATATKLATARTIGGVSFDGTVSINLPGVNTAGNQSTTGNAATATKVNNSILFTTNGGAASGTSFDGSVARQISFSTVGAPSFLGDGAEGTWNISILGTATSVSSTLVVSKGGTGVTTSTGTGSVVLNTNPILTLPTINGGYIEQVEVLTGTAPSISVTNGSIKSWTLTANSSITSALTTGQSVTLMIDDGAGYTITWPTIAWKTDQGFAPVLNLTTITAIQLWNVGGILYGARVGDA